MNIQYRVVSHSDEINICWEINRKLRDGWKLQGGIAVIEDKYDNRKFYQAMIKETK